MRYSSFKSILAFGLVASMCFSATPLQAITYDVSGIPTKNTGDAITAAEVNLIVDMLRNLRWDDRDDGNVLNNRLGIGIGGAPGYELDVEGTTRSGFFIGDGSQLTNLPDTSLWTQTASDLYYNGGDVAIGINSSPTYQLEVHNPAGDSAIDTVASGSNDASLRLTNGNQVWIVRNNGGAGNRLELFNETDGTASVSIDASSNQATYAGDIYAPNFIDSDTGRPVTGKFVEGLSNDDAVYLTGNVGIGTNNPQNLLHIDAGTGGVARIEIESADSPRGNYIGVDGHDNLLLAADEDDLGTASSLQFRVDAQEMMRINENGNVGIGITNPLYALDTDDGAVRARELVFYPASNGADDKLSIRGMNVSTMGIFSDSMIDLYESDASERRARFDLNNGRFGFGSDFLPTEELHVRKNTTEPTTVLVENASTASGANVRAGVTASANDGLLDVMVYGTGATGNLGDQPKADSAFIRTTSGVPTSRMVVGNGSATPIHFVTDDTTRLTIEGDGDVALQTGKYLSLSGTGNSTAIRRDTGNNGLEVVTGGSTSMFVSDSGNVGIGTVTPSTELDVIGTITADNFVKRDGSSLGGKFVDGTNANDAVYTTGNVGIGTTSPTEKLGVVSSGEDVAHLDLQNASADTILTLDSSDGAIASGSYFLRAKDGGVDRFVLRGDGNVGIGTANPNNKLEVAGGNLLLDNNYSLGFKTSGGSARSMVLMEVDDNLRLGNTGAGDGNDSISFDVTNRADVMNLASNGNVGIGTNTPSAPLHVKNGTSLGSILDDETIMSRLEGRVGPGNAVHLVVKNIRTLGGSADWGDSKTRMQYSVDENVNKRMWMDFISEGTDVNDNQIAFGEGIGEEWMRIDNGNVGIGTTNPTAKLSLAKADGEALSIGVDLEGSSSIKFYDDDDELSQNFRMSFDAGTQDLSFSSDDVSDILYLTESGNVGIGTTSPGARLHVSDSAANLRLTDTDTGADGYVLTNSSVGGMILSADHDGEVVGSYLGLRVDGADYMRILENGNVGIGTTNPTHSLELGVRDSGSEKMLMINGGGVGSDEGGELRLAMAADHDGTYNHYYIDAFRDDLRIGRSGVGTDFVLTDSGQIGIGDASPEGTLKLDVEGQVGVVELCDQNGSNCTTPAALAGAAGNSSPKFVDGLDADDAVYTVGNVGIGTTSPTGKLGVVSSGEDVAHLDLQNASADTILTLDSSDGAIASGSYFLRAKDGGVDKFVLRGDGNVGIGTSSPTAKLSLAKADGEALSIGVDLEGSSSIKFYDDDDELSQNFRMSFDAGTQDLSFSSDDVSDILYLTESGNVGIGTTSPGARLHVSDSAANLRLTDTDTGADGYVLTNSSVGGMILSADHDGEVVGSYLGLRVDGADYMRILENGNVGIGTTNPSNKLEVAGGNLLLDNNYSLGFKTSGGSARSMVLMEVDDNLRLGNTGAGDGNDSISFDVTNRADVMNLASNGNVGMGVLNPSRKLEVRGEARVGTGSTADLVLKGGVVPVVSAGGSNSASVISTTGTGSASYHVGVEIPANDINDGFYVSTDSNQDGTVDKLALKINSLGNVGIGTTSPGEDLHISGTAANIRLTDTDTGADGYIITNSGVGGLVVSADQNNEVAGSYLGLNVDGTEQVRVSANGNVGIGTTSPGYSLELGVRDSGSEKMLMINGGGVGSDEGGELRLAMAADHDGTYDHYYIDAFRDDLRIGRSGVGTDFVLTDSGQIGIGDASPEGTLKLDVEGQIGAVEICDENGNNCTTPAALAGAAGNSAPKFIDGTDANDAVYMTGNVGVGINTPSSSLEVVGDIETDRICDRNGTNCVSPADIAGATSNGAPKFIDGTNANDAVYITGNVGIGTAAPQNKLHVEGTSFGAGAMRFNNTANTGSSTYWELGERSFSSTNSDFEINANGTPRLTISETGNVGLGVTSPDEKIMLSGSAANIRLTDTDTGADSYIITNSNVGGMMVSADQNNEVPGSYLGLRVDGTEQVRVSANGNVGLGTTNPLSPLHTRLDADDGTIAIFANEDVPLFEVISGGFGNHSLGKIKLSGANDIGGIRGVGGTIAANTRKAALQISDAVMQFDVTEFDGSVTLGNLYNWSNNDVQMMTLNNAGFLGIGTTTPSSRLEVVGDIETDRICDRSGGNCTSPADLASGGNSKFVDGTNVNDAVYTTGNVGIGTTSPTEKLEVGGDIKMTGGASTLRFNDTNDNDFLVHNNSDKLYFMHDANDNNNWDDGEDDRVVMAGEVDGVRLGVGTSDPWEKLDVLGNVRIRSGRNIYFGTEDQRLYGDNGSAFYLDSNNSTTVQQIFRDKEDTVYGRVYGAANGASFGLLDGDGNWGIQMVKDDIITFNIDNSEKVRILENGNVGIGSTNPGEKVHVSGSAANVRLTDTDTGADGYIITNSGVGGMVISADQNNEVAGSYLGLNVDGTEQARVTAGGDFEYSGSIKKASGAILCPAGQVMLGLDDGSDSAASVSSGDSAHPGIICDKPPQVYQ